MSALNTAILVIWVVFWGYWLIAAAGVKQGARTRRIRPPGLLLVALFLLSRVFRVNGLVVHSQILQMVGTILFLVGLGLAVWARVYLGRNWGMPMTRKDEPELVTSGPYRFVRHPIYTGILLAVLGTALAVNGGLLIAFGVMSIYFIYSARVEERMLRTTFPTTYAGYTAKTKMLIPFVL